MRVLFVCPGLGYGGAETQLMALASGLVAHGHQVTVYAMSASGSSRPNTLEEQGVALIFDEKRRRFDFSLIRRLRAYVRDWQPDIVHGFLFDGNLYARFASVANGGVPCLSSERSSDYRLRRAQAFAHVLTKQLTRAVVANSYAGAIFAARLFGLPLAHVHVVWNGIDLEQVQARARAASGLRERLGLRDGDKLLCFVGSIKPEKDFGLAIGVVRELLSVADEGWHFLFVGAAYIKHMAYRVQELDQSLAYADLVEQDFASLPDTERVHRVGAVDNVIELLAQSDVLLSTSLREGFPNVVLEAMACGVPVVSTEYSDIRHILPQAWQVVAERKPSALAQAVRRASAESQLLGQQQRDWVAQHAGLEQAVSAMEGVYSQYLNGTQTP